MQTAQDPGRCAYALTIRIEEETTPAPLTISHYCGVGVELGVASGVGLFSGFSGVGEADGFSGVGVASGVGVEVTLGLGDGEAVALLEG
jgi:hypothetical protein